MPARLSAGEEAAQRLSLANCLAEPDGDSRCVRIAYTQSVRGPRSVSALTCVLLGAEISNLPTAEKHLLHQGFLGLHLLILSADLNDPKFEGRPPFAHVSI